jgi:hypothetical protein
VPAWPTRPASISSRSCSSCELGPSSPAPPPRPHSVVALGPVCLRAALYPARNSPPNQALPPASEPAPHRSSHPRPCQRPCKGVQRSSSREREARGGCERTKKAHKKEWARCPPSLSRRGQRTSDKYRVSAPFFQVLVDQCLAGAHRRLGMGERMPPEGAKMALHSSPLWCPSGRFRGGPRGGRGLSAWQGVCFPGAG